MPLIVQNRQWLYDPCSDIPIVLAIAGKSAVTRTRCARRVKCVFVKASYTLSTPAASSLSSSTIDLRNDWMSRGLLGPGMMPQSKRLCFLKRSAGFRLRLIKRRGHTESGPTLKSARPSVLKASAISRVSPKKPLFLCSLCNLPSQ